MGSNPVKRAIETITNFYKQREMNLARELVDINGYHSGDFARVQKTSRQAAYSYYKPILKKGEQHDSAK